MHKILVCDDEKWIRKGIIAKIQYYKFDFLQVMEAVDGKEAFEIIKTEKPDIVLTDVKMPNMTGIDLITKVKDLYPEIKFIIISGYAEFNYVQQAINLGAKGYILKPISDENLISNLNKVIDELNSERRISQIIGKEQELAKINEEYRLESEVNEILNSKDDIFYQQEQGIIFKYIKKHPKYMMALISIPIEEYVKLESSKLTKEELVNLLKKKMKEHNSLVVYNSNDAHQVFIISSDYSELKLKKSFEEYIENVVSQIKEELDIQLIAALSGITDGISSLMYKQARSAFQSRIINNTTWIYKYSALNKNKLKVFEYPEEKLKVLSKCIVDGDVKNAHIILKDIFSLKNLEINSSEGIHFLLSECVNMLIKICNKKEMDINIVIPYKLLATDRICNYYSLDEIVQDINDIITRINHNTNESIYNTKNIVNKLKQYIDENYGAELTVNALAQKFLINPNYLSNLFSKETGLTITKYITKLRMGKACKLLEETSINIADISGNVGYQDPQYFYRVFKKEMNKTPAEYRSKT